MVIWEPLLRHRETSPILNIIPYSLKARRLLLLLSGHWARRHGNVLGPVWCTLRVYWPSSPVCCLQNWSLYLSGRHLLILSCANWIPSCFEKALPWSWKVQVAFTQKTFWEQPMVFTVGAIIEGIIFYSGASKQKGLLGLKCVVFWNACLAWRRTTGLPILALHFLLDTSSLIPT